MSIWSDIQDRSAGMTKRKEDEIEEDVRLKVFCGAVNSIADLPQNAQPDSIYIAKDIGQIVIFQNNMWELIVELTIQDNHQWMFYGAVNSIEDLPQNAQPDSIYITKDTNQIVIFQHNMWISIGGSIYTK